MNPTPNTNPTPAERVAVGAAFLDEHRPGWAAKVNTKTLRMGNCLRCVLGQLFGDYYDALDHHIGAHTPWARGFDIDEHEALASFGDNRARGIVYGRLTRAWKAEIAKRVSP